MDAFCQIQRGFFIKRSCGHASVMQCQQCERAICPSHRADDAGVRILCVDCATKDDADLDRPGSWETDRLAPSYYRRRYYDSGYTPIFWDDADAGNIDSTPDTDLPDPPDNADATDLSHSSENEAMDGDDDVSAFDS